jgi:hypothetical protein
MRFSRTGNTSVRATFTSTLFENVYGGIGTWLRSVSAQYPKRYRAADLRSIELPASSGYNHSLRRHVRGVGVQSDSPLSRKRPRPTEAAMRAIMICGKSLPLWGGRRLIRSSIGGRSRRTEFCLLQGLSARVSREHRDYRLTQTAGRALEAAWDGHGNDIAIIASLQ